MAAYSISGLFSGLVTGATLAFIGTLASAPRWAGIVTIAIGLYAFAREAAWNGLPLPEVRRQTRARWFSGTREFLNPMIWGLDVGLAFATYLSFAGIWLLGAISLTSDSVIFGALIFAVLWMGRAMPHWFEPWLQGDPAATIKLVDFQNTKFASLRLAHGYAIAAWLIALVLATLI